MADDGLPIPAWADIVIEGEIPPPEVEIGNGRAFGEWTGTMPREPALAGDSHQIGLPSQRSDSTVLPDFKSHPLSSYMFLVFCAAGLWNEIRKRGLRILEACGSRNGACVFSGDSVKQRYGGHARQAAHIALGAREGAYLGRFIVLVDDDIDPEHGRCHARRQLAATQRLGLRLPPIAGAAPSSASDSRKAHRRRFYELARDNRRVPAFCVAR